MNGDDELDGQYARSVVKERPDIARAPGVRQAEHDLSWAETFNSTPPTEVLRARRNLVDLVGNAVDNKQRLLAQTDEKAASLYFKTKEFEEWQAQAPMRDQLMQAQINTQTARTNAVGAGDRFRAWKDEQTAKQTSDFFTGLPDLEKQFPVTHPEHGAEFARYVARFPYALGNAEVKDYIKTHADWSDSTAALQQNLTKFGMKPTSLTTEIGGATVRAEAPDSEKVPPAVRAHVSELHAEQRSDQAYLDKETDPAKQEALKKQMGVRQAQLDSWHTDFPSLKPTASTPENAPTVATAPANTVSVPPPADRIKDQVYPTPKGNLKWTGTGWLTP